jgi:Recombination endonuclease VII
VARITASSGQPRKRRTADEIRRAKAKATAARKHWLKTRHHMTLEQYESLKEFQEGVCPICRRSNGSTKALAVEHNHAIAREACDHPEKESCINCWRGLMCGPCNDILAWLRDDAMAIYRAIDYLRNPPARRWRMLLPCFNCGQERYELGQRCEKCDVAGL